MVFAETTRVRFVDEGDTEMGEPQMPEYELEVSSEFSEGALARRLWEEEFAKFVEILPERMQVLYTGIGGGIAHQEGTPRIWRFGDFSEVPGLIDLKEVYGQVPELLFLVASAKTTENVLGLRGMAREYKERYWKDGLKGIIGVLTALAHERQDRRFNADGGSPIPQVTTLKDVINLLVEGGDIDGGVLIGGHSLRPSELARRKGFPLIPIDTYRLLVSISGFGAIPREELLIMGPDKGRRNVSKMMATKFGCLFASAIKTRARLEDGRPSLYIDPKILEYILINNLTVAIFDDEIREGGTIGGLASELFPYANGIKVCIFKAICAECAEKDGKSAVDYLNHPLIDQIIITDAVQPLTDLRPIKHKLQVYSLKPDIDALVNYLRHNLVRPQDPYWLQDSQKTGTPLRLDLAVEKFD